MGDTLHQSHEQWLRELLRDEAFMVFMQEQLEGYATEEAFFAQDMPAGIDPAAAWDFVLFMRRMAAFPRVKDTLSSKSGNLEERAYWCMPPQTLEVLGDLYAETDVASQLWQNVEPLLMHRRLHKPIVEDLYACALRDGFALDYEGVQELVRHRRAPINNEERIVANTIAVLEEIDRYAGPITGEVLQRLYERVTEGVETFPGRRRSLPQTPYTELFQRDPEKPFTEIAKRLAMDDAWGTQPLLGLIMSSAIIWSRWPFPHCNEFMELAIRWIYVRNVGVPALRAVPATKLRLDWEMGLLHEDAVSFSYGEAVIVSDFGADSTPYLIIMTRLLAEAVERLRTEVDRICEKDAGEKAAIEGDARLSHRQQVLLCDMVDNPLLVADVATYAERFGTAVSTAREDLNKLVSLGYCLTEFVGKKQVYWRRQESVPL